MITLVRRYVIPATILAVGMAFSNTLVADPPEYPNGLPFQAIKQDFDNVLEAIGNLSNELTVEVALNLQACAALPVQCADFGYVNPAEGNNSPIQLVAAVSRGGEPVTGLAFEDFAYLSGPVAPGGALVQFCTDDHQGDTVCNGLFFFEAGSGGTYNMWLRPSNFQTWDDGMYAGTLSVSDEDGSGVALVSFSIQ
ncbi:MAG: hypothetical protein R3348_03715 [Xanthomonadales bacterium]|nr:hypothetical protein [Xanthomonadales bacterium]